VIIRLSLLSWSVNIARAFCRPQSMWRIARNRAGLGALLFDFTSSPCVFPQISCIGCCLFSCSSHLDFTKVRPVLPHRTFQKGMPICTTPTDFSQVLKLF
jgi:hypothetical protein